MWYEWGVFTVLSVLSNTPIPIAFDPILLVFAGNHAGSHGTVAAFVGAFGAGLGGMVELLIFRRLPHRLAGVESVRAQPPDRRFYAWVAFLALTPVPFTVARLAAYLRKPRLFPYGLAIVVGRLPRHLIIVCLATTFTLPVWVTPAALALALSPFGFKLLSRARKNASSRETNGRQERQIRPYIAPGRYSG